jgi:hypothetical protein
VLRTEERYAALRRSSFYGAGFVRVARRPKRGKQKLEQLPLQLAIAFFAFQVAAWAGLCLYLRAERQRRREEVLALELSDAPVAQAA